MAKKAKVGEKPGAVATPAPTGRFHVVVTPKAFKEILAPLRIENYYDPALIVFGEKDKVKINAHDAGKQTMLFIEGKYDGLRVLIPGEMVVNPTEMMKHILPKFGNHAQFSIQEQEDNSYWFFDEWGARIEWDPDAKSECRVVKDTLIPKHDTEDQMVLFGGQVTTDCKVTGKAAQFQMAGGDATAAGADYIELNFDEEESYSASGHLVAGTRRSRTPLDIELIGSPAKAVVPKSFAKFAGLLTGDVSVYTTVGASAIVMEAHEPDRSYLILVGTTEPTEPTAEEKKEDEEKAEPEEEEEGA
jgi:hypothetical protein